MEKLTIPPDNEGYTFQDINGTLFQELDGGVGRQRKDFLDANTTVQVQWTVKGVAEYDYLRNFYKAYLGRNCEPFLIDLPTTTAALAEKTATFIAFKPIGSLNGLSYMVIATLEIQESAEATAGTDGDFWPVHPDEICYNFHGADVAVYIDTEYHEYGCDIIAVGLRTIARWHQPNPALTEFDRWVNGRITYSPTAPPAPGDRAKWVVEADYQGHDYFNYAAGANSVELLNIGPCPKNSCKRKNEYSAPGMQFVNYV